MKHNQKVPNYPCKTVIYGVHGVKGGSGKSTAIAATAEWLKSEYPKARITVADIDGETSTFKRLTKLPIVEIRRNEFDGISKLIEIALHGESDIILFDAPASSLEEMTQFYDQIEFEQIKELGIRIACHCVINPAPDSIKTAKDWLERMPSWMINTAYFNKMSKFPEGVDPLSLTQIEDLTAEGIWVPEFPKTPMDLIDENDLTFAKAYEQVKTYNRSRDQSLFIENLTTYMNEVRLQSLVANLHGAFRRMEHIFLPDQLIDSPKQEQNFA